MRNKSILLIAFLFLLASSCQELENVSDTKEERMQSEESIGIATMKHDGTIVLQLRAEGNEGLLGDALLEYKPDDNNYEKILEHLGGLEKGETKLVSPWSDE